MSNTPHIMKAFTYLRVSGKSQIEGDGFDRQREVIAKRCRDSDIEIVREFVEAGISGTSDLEDRPALSELFAAAVSDGVRTVIVERSDRFSRDLMVGEVLLDQFRKDGITVIEAEDGRDLTMDDPDNATGTLVRQILAVVAQFEKTSIVAKLRKARNRKKQETGRCEGVKPFGLKDGEKETLDRMLALRGEELTVRQITDHLNAEGLSTRTGRPWHHASVAKILSRHLQSEPEFS